MRDALEAREYLEQFGLLAGALAEVRGDRVADPGRMLPQHARESRKALAPRGEARIWIRGECPPLEVEGLRERRGMGHEAGGIL